MGVSGRMSIGRFGLSFQNLSRQSWDGRREQRLEQHDDLSRAPPCEHQRSVRPRDQKPREAHESTDDADADEVEFQTMCSWLVQVNHLIQTVNLPASAHIDTTEYVD